MRHFEESKTMDIIDLTNVLTHITLPEWTNINYFIIILTLKFGNYTNLVDETTNIVGMWGALVTAYLFIDWRLHIIIKIDVPLSL